MKIAIVKLSALGDIVHAMVVLQFIKQFNCEILVDWIVEEAFRDLLTFHPHINAVHTVNLKQAKKTKSILFLFKELKKLRNLKHYDLVIDMQGLIKSAIISRLISSDLTIGFDRSSIRESAASYFYNKTFQCQYEKNIIERNFEIIKFALAFSFDKKEIINKRPCLPINNAYLNLNISKSKKNIILIPGASYLSKMYPLEKFSKLSKLLDANYLIIWGDLKEKRMAEEIKELSPNVKICSKLSLKSLVALISNADLVIGPDTGPTHISWAINVPSITLFGPTPGYRNTYETDKNKIIESNSRVNPYKIDKNDFSIQDISVDEIILVARDLLKQN
jgi:heptosyltransferase I